MMVPRRPMRWCSDQLDSSCRKFAEPVGVLPSVVGGSSPAVGICGGAAQSAFIKPRPHVTYSPRKPTEGCELEVDARELRHCLRRIELGQTEGVEVLAESQAKR